MKHLFGPVNSRRLGLSLGIDLLPAKTCNFNCIYCEVGETTIFQDQRAEYIPTREILAEIDAFLAADNSPPIDIFTITASGEPTLHSGLGEIIGHLKKMTGKPVAVLTNGSLFFRQDVREELLKADIVVPSLDAAREKSFRKLNRPVAETDLSAIINGLARFSSQYEGSLWLEILFVKNINDSSADLAALREAIDEIQPDKIQLNTVARPPLEDFAGPLSRRELEEIAATLPAPVEIIAQFSERPRQHTRAAQRHEILHMLQRRPCTLPDICEALNLEASATGSVLQEMEKDGQVARLVHQGKSYYQTLPVRRRDERTDVFSDSHAQPAAKENHERHQEHRNDKRRAG